MVRRESERVQAMKREFMNLHKEGLGIREIAERFNLNISTVYYRLGEIAEKNGVRREELLSRVISRKPNNRSLNEQDREVRVTFEEIQSKLELAHTSIKEASQKIDKILEEQK